MLFYEYFHGDNGAGIGCASHQTGWTGIVERGMHLFATSTAEQLLKLGKVAAVVDAAFKTGGRRSRGDSLINILHSTNPAVNLIRMAGCGGTLAR